LGDPGTPRSDVDEMVFSTSAAVLKPRNEPLLGLSLRPLDRAILAKQAVQSGKAEQDVFSVRDWPQSLFDDTAQLRDKDWRQTYQHDGATAAAADAEGQYILESNRDRGQIGGIAVRDKLRFMKRLD
jgi:hypothetical protein